MTLNPFGVSVTFCVSAHASLCALPFPSALPMRAGSPSSSPSCAAPELPGWVAKDEAQQNPWLFDHLVGAGEEQFRNCQFERLGSREIDNEVELGRLLHRDIAGFRPTQNLVNIVGSAPDLR
jgi:hypothetical protein